MAKITTIKREIEMNQSKDKVWKALADFGNICHGHPAVSKSFITSTQKAGVGATRHCDFTMMGASAHLSLEFPAIRKIDFLAQQRFALQQFNHSSP